MPRLPLPSSAPIAAVTMLVAGLGVLISQDIIMKELTVYYSVPELLGLRTCFSILALRVVLLAMGYRDPLHTRRLWLQLMRGGALLVALTFYYLALTLLPLINVAAIFFVGPLIATVVAAMFLREPVGWRRGLAVLLGFLGGMLIIQPDAGVFQSASLMAVASAFFYAAVLVLSRMLGDSEPAGTTAYYSLICYLVLSFAGVGVVEAAVFGGFDPGLFKPWVGPTLPHLSYLALCGLLTAIGFICLAAAYRFAPVTMLAPFEYTGILWSGVLAYLVWGEVPTATTLAGAGLVIASGVYVVRRPV